MGGAVPGPVVAQKAAETPQPESEAPAPKRFAGPRKHIVQPGENLRIIAQKYYNDPSQWKVIYKANKDKIVGGQIMPGLEITIPPADKDEQ